MPLNEYQQPIGDAVTVPALGPPAQSDMIGRFCRLERLNIEMHSSDLAAAFTASADNADWTYLPYGPFDAEADFARWLSKMAKAQDPMFFAVTGPESGRALGLASYLRIEPRNAAIEVGHIHFSRELQRTPATTEAMFLMMQQAFEAGYRRYEWKCDALNAPSRAAAARLGFTFEGVFRQATHYKGRNRDTAWFAVIDGDWPTRHAEFSRWLDSANFADDGTQLTSLAHDV